MDGTAVGSELTFAVATPADDAALCQLLRNNPMAGRIRISLEREPSYFVAAATEGPEHHTIIARESGRVVCAGTISVRDRFINGISTRVGYLGGLRLDASCRGRASIVRRGYQKFRTLHEQGGPLLYLTSIVADNLPALRLLERGLKDMPTYRYLGDFITLVIRTRRRANRSAAPQDARAFPGILEFLNRENARYQFAPVWSAQDMQVPERMLAVGLSDAPIACAALWDQRKIKQAVVRGYSAMLSYLRHFLNAASAIFRRPRLPAVDEALASAFISHVAGSATELPALIRQLQAAAFGHGLEYLVLGFDARDPRLAIIRKSFRPRQYVGRLYAVHWEDGAAAAQALDGRLLAPEVALL